MINIKKLNKAIVFTNNEEFDSAEKIYSELICECPNDSTVLSFWGLFNLKRGLFVKAEKILESAYKIKKLPSTIASLAFTKFKLKKFDDAIILYEELFRYDKDSEQIYQKIIESFRALDMFNFAGAYCQKYFKAHPKSRHALFLMTQHYMDIGNYKKAEEFCAQTIDMYPNNSASWVHAGFLQELLYNNEEVAQECYRKAIEFNDIQAFYHLAVSLQKTRKFEEAEIFYKKALSVFPDSPDIKASLGCLYLIQRQFNKGFELFVQRSQSKEISTLRNLWNGRLELLGNRLLVYADQGLGDGIQFARYLPYLKEKFSQIIVFVRTPLKSLLKHNFKDILITDTGLSELEYDSSILMMDIPYYLGMDFEHIPFVDGYLSAENDKVSYFKNKYFNHDKLKVGLCWKAADMGIRNAINRTINIDYFKSLLELNNVEFYSFQKDDIFDALHKYPQIIDVAGDFDSFDDTAAAMKNLDLMISVDTSCAHLAGALGVKTQLLIPYCSDWRWFDNKNKTEWYSSIDIIKQQERQDWYKEVDILKEYLSASSK